jgi:flagellar protein FlaF
MGFSVSGAAAIIFISLFIAFGMWFTAASNTFEQVTEAEEMQADSTLESSNTELEITSATYNESGNRQLVVTANNTGAEGLSLNGTDLLVDGVFVDGWQPDAEVEGNSGTDLWLSGEQLQITLDRSQPQRVKLVTESGVSATATVEVFP